MFKTSLTIAAICSAIFMSQTPVSSASTVPGENAIVFVQGDTINKDSVYTEVDQAPEFVGGMQALAKFLGHNMRYPGDAMKQKKMGTVLIGFVVNADGKILNPVVDKTSGTESLDREALRVVSLMPAWNPAILKGQKVAARHVLPIKFKLH